MAHLPVLITVTNKQKDEEGQEQIIKMTCEGRLYDRGDETILVYREDEASGMENTLTTVAIAKHKDEVMLSRVGEHQMKMHFQAGNHYQTRMSTPFGLFDLNFTTQQLKLQRGSDEGQIEINYALDFNHQRPLRNEIHIKYHPLGRGNSLPHD